MWRMVGWTTMMKQMWGILDGDLFSKHKVVETILYEVIKQRMFNIGKGKMYQLFQ